MDVRILKFVAQVLNTNYTTEYKDYFLFDHSISAHEEMLDLLFELGYVKPVKYNGYKFTEKALDILNEENKWKKHSQLK